MYAKVHLSMWDGSLGASWPAWSVFVFLLASCDREGVVSMTADGIARRTSIPLDLVMEGLSVLEAPDPLSRTPAEDGRRIQRHDPDRPNGWTIVNYERYREMQTVEDKRRNWKESKARARSRQADLNLGSGPRVDSGGTEVDVSGREWISPHVPTRQMQMEKQIEPTLSSLRSDKDAPPASADSQDRPQESGDGRSGPKWPVQDQDSRGPHPTAVGLPCSRGTDWWPLPTEVEEWGRLFPGVDVVAQLRRMRAWLLAKPARRKTPRGMSAFIVNWLSREQDKGSPMTPERDSPRRRADREYARLNNLEGPKS